MFSSNSKLPIGLSILFLTISSALAAKCVGQEGIGDPPSAEDTLSLNLEGIADAVTLFRSGRYGECRERLIAAAECEATVNRVTSRSETEICR